MRRRTQEGCSVTLLLVIGIVIAVIIAFSVRAKADGMDMVELDHHVAGFDTALLEQTADPSEPEAKPETISLGTFTVTGYCSCELCCGKDDGITATGVKATTGHTIAVDPSVIPLGSTVLIGGKEYVAEDTGKAVKGNVIDIYFGSHQLAQKWGVHELQVEVLK